MNITETANAFLYNRLVTIAKSGNAEALQSLLAGTGLPALARDDEPAEQIFNALESGDYGNLARRITRLLAKLLHQRAESLERSLAAMGGAAIGGRNAQMVSSPYLEDETYVYNLFLLSSRLPRDEALFGGLRRFFDIGFTRGVIITTTGNRAGFQLRRALAEQQTDLSLRDYFQDLLEDKKRPWNPGRRTELLEAWRGLLGSLNFDKDRDDTLRTIDRGLRAIHDTVEPHPESIDLLTLALWHLDNSFPLDSPTWVSYLESYWADWPELLRDIAAETWPGLDPQPLDELPSLPEDMVKVWDAFGDEEQANFRDIIRRNAAEEGQSFINQLLFKPFVVSDLPLQEVRNLLMRLADHFWPKKESPKINTPDEPEQRLDINSQQSKRRVSMDRLSRMEAVNRTLTEIERHLAEGHESIARRFVEELIEQQRKAVVADSYQHTAKTLSKAATIAQRYGLLEWAENLLREACEENPNDEVSANGLADVLKARGELEAAEQQYRQNTARWPNDEVSACGLADVLKVRGELEAAEQQYRQNTARWPNDEVSACGLADVLKARGELEAAEQQYRQNTARWPNDEVSACGLADVLKARGELEAAEQQYRQNTARWPNDEVSACGLADVLKARGELEAAEQQYRQNTARWPNNEVSACGLADVLKARGELEAAEQQYRQNTARWPNDEVSACGLADVLKARGELEAAEQQYRQNTARWPNDEVSACGLADVLKARGELEAAEQQYRQNTARWPNNEVSACGLADVLKARGELEAAEQQYRQNTARWPNDEVSANGLADVLKARGELEAAEQQYRQNTARWPNDEVSANGLADVLKARGELEAAEQQYRQNTARWPNDEVSANGLADVLKARGELEAAEQQYRQNTARWPNDEVSANGLADVLKARGELEAAEQQYRQNTARWPNNEVSACGLADVLKARGELEAAEQQYRQNTARWPNDEVSANGLADVLKARGELEAAEQQYRQNTARWPNDEVSANGLADVLKARGELEAAEQQYRQNTARWPNSHFVVNGLANVLRKLKRHPEALSLLSSCQSPDCHDLHLRAMILLDLGRIEDARISLIEGQHLAITPVQKEYFQRGLALLEIRARQYDSAREILARLPGNVIPLDLFRLHTEVAQGETAKASELLHSLEARRSRMNFNECKVFELVRQGFGLNVSSHGHQPNESELEKIFDAEMELQLAVNF
ncbi:tetratricopeptide repeat protein [Desulfosudis oleivorans]|uniref:TPR repeat-containing protein n=1 Tax=Desulfosudis oleivorans (strain DSM 6200 / JCM 39069 / Hxd3) TaxID=96561 RepID=A8ZXN4_DESOH|nr:tetratricopeptide repeat protein [Desulfosudis oleivorans]ABW66992.1 TPR repeat-containing protein [Desulfosudis oleivorans Hxd3]